MSSATLDRKTDEPEGSRLRRRRMSLVIEPACWLVAAGSVAGAVSQWTILPGIVRVAFLLGFVTTAPGSAVLLWWRGISRPGRAVLVPLLGVALVVLLTATLAFAKEWNAEDMLYDLIAASLVSVVVRVAVVRGGATRRIPAPAAMSSDAADSADTPAISEADDSPVEPLDEDVRFELELEHRGARWHGAGPSRYAVPALLALAAIAWLTCLPSVGHARASAWGLLVAAAPGYAISLVLVALAGIVAMVRRDVVGLFAAAAGLIIVERLTTSIGTAVPILPWTYKHIAVVDYVDRYHYVVRGTDIYHSWPGMFTASAWLDELTGVAPITLAHWFTPVYHVGLVAAVYGAARAWRRAPIVAAAGAFVFEACNFVIQDYFSPQALGYLLAIGVLVGVGESMHRRVASVPVLVIFAAVTVTHQLTPYWLILVVAGLVVVRRLRPWWLPIAFAAVAGGYLYWNYAVASKYGKVTSTDPLKNIRLTAKAEPLLGIRTQFYAIVFLYLVLFGSVGIALLLRLIRRRGNEWRAPAVIALAPVLLLAVQGYGGEAIFRVVLYSLPGLSIVAASLALRALARARWSAVIATSLVALTVMVAGHAYLGSYSAYRVDASEVAVWKAYNRAAPIRSYLVSLAPGFPGNPEWYYVPRHLAMSGYSLAIFNGESRVVSTFRSDGQYRDFMDLLLGSRTSKDPPLYLALSEGQQTYSNLYGVLPEGATANLRTHIATDARWTLITNDGSSWLYRLDR